jgi:lysophospholipase L1-like esterase
VLEGCAKREIKNLDSKGTNIICFGDSITFGYGANPGEDYPSALAKMINASVINAGIDGDTSVEALKRLKSDVLDREPLLVIIEFGGNDFLRKIPQEVTMSNIKEMVERIQAQGAMAAIVDMSAGIFLQEYRKAFAEIAHEKSAIFIPSILSGVITNPNLKSDFIHPNADGYKIIAQRIYRTILPYLNQNTLSKRFQK